EGDVQGALGKTVDGRVARRGRRVHARQHDDEITRIAGDERKINDLVDEQGSGDVSRLRLHHLAAAMDNDGFVRRPDFQSDPDCGRRARIQLDTRDDGLLEAWRGDGHGVSARIQGWDGKSPVAGSQSTELRAGGVVLDHYCGAWNDGARWINHRAGEG